MKLTRAIESEDDDPVVGVIRPLTVRKQRRRGAERGEQRGDGAMSPGNERMISVLSCAKKGNECGGIFCADGAVERETGGVAERLEREARANAVRGVGAGEERVDTQVEAAVMERLEVVDIGVGACLAGGRQITAE